jgi:hypothetical protein
LTASIAENGFHEQDGRIRQRPGPRHRHPMSHAAGELIGVEVHGPFEADDAQNVDRARVHRVFFQSAHFETESDIA